ncbi:hypothetical protein E3N88_36362 [Mikania micrantha]|uniref:Uncharacterized protein n=1 Tax=Mikania micrantha TaxID=192012 RepID=A0A5N6M3X3_9ASTR|nr:hypothetical protein E3N88_36362 [Mikania micrantha]
MLYSVVFEHKIGYTQFIKVGFRSQCANMYPESSARVVVSNALMANVHHLDKDCFHDKVELNLCYELDKYDYGSASVENDKLKKGESRGGAENKEEDVVMDGDKEWDWEQCKKHFAKTINS